MAEIGRNINIAFGRGQDAFGAKWTLADNPYRASSTSWKAWRAGWCSEFKADSARHASTVAQGASL